MKILPSYNEVKKLSKKGNVLPIYTEILADMETPISAYLKIAQNEDYSFLLESVSGENKFARYTFLGSNPYIKVKAKDDKITFYKNGEIEEFDIEEGKDPLSYVKQLMQDYLPVKLEGLPNFVGGAVGYMGYDIVKYFENIEDTNKNVVDVPDLFFMLTDTIIVFDRFKQKLLIVCNLFLDENDNLEKVYENGKKKIKKLYDKLQGNIKRNYLEDSKKEYEIKSNFKKEEFCESVEKAVEYIKKGDIFQVVLSQRFYTDYEGDSFEVYRKLRSINPSPYMFYLDFKEFQIVGASPEILVKLEGDKITLRPIAGTRKRGKTVEEDIALEQELLNDEKELAEHVMLIDLGRNDVGKISKYGTVKVTEKMVIEKYSHVMHIVSSVQGTIKDNKDGFDLLRSTFPAGTLSGAPKIRAMEIIEELENDKRGIYGGAIGYFSFNGDLDSCITIRTLLMKDKKAYMQAGAGIVYDSVPKKEYQETENKIAAVIKALK